MKIDGGLMGNLAKSGTARNVWNRLGFTAPLPLRRLTILFSVAPGGPETENIELVTSIAVAFARTPMNLANIGHDLNSFSKPFYPGSWITVRPHITKRFSMPWSRPAARMREFILAMRAIWDCWHNGTPLTFQGEFYTHSLMTPMFTPVDIEFGAPKVFLAAVGPKMSEVAGEVADGILIHAFTTEKYLREVTLPAVESGLAKAGKSREGFEISYPGFIVTGQTEEAFNASKTATCKQIAFYGSTPAYAPVLGVHGWGDLQPELNRLSKQGQWDDMGTLITDEILNEFAIVGELDDVVSKFKDRWGGLVDRTTGSLPARNDDHAREMLQEMSA